MANIEKLDINFMIVILLFLIVLLSIYFFVFLDLNTGNVNLDLFFIEIDFQLGNIVLITFLSGIVVSTLLELIYFSIRRKKNRE